MQTFVVVLKMGQLLGRWGGSMSKGQDVRLGLPFLLCNLEAGLMRRCHNSATTFCLHPCLVAEVTEDALVETALSSATRSLLIRL